MKYNNLSGGIVEMYKNTVLKTTSETFVNGLSLSEIGTSLYNLSSEQLKYMKNYAKKMDVELNVLPKNLNFSDASFVEDIAVLITYICCHVKFGCTCKNGRNF